MNILLGVDIGTTKLCVVALDADTGTVRAVRSAANDTVISSEPDASEQDASSIICRAIGLLKETVASFDDSAKIVAIGITGQMHGVLLIDSDGRPLTPLINWQDQSGNRRYQSSDHTFVDEVCNRIESNIDRTGTTPATGYGAVTLFRMAQNSEIPSNATALTIHDYLVRQLTGKAVTDPTDAASWGIYDVQGASGWLQGIENDLDLPAGLLPEICSTGSVAGRLLPDIASQIGLPDGTPVIVALGDNQASFLGSVPSLASSVLFNIGTGGQMSVSSDKYACVQGLDTRPLVTRKWLKVGASLCGGSAFKILASFFASVGADLFNCDVPPEALYDKMTALADLLPDDECPVIAPYFNGTRTDASRAAQITRLRSSNFTPAHLSKAMIRGMVDELISFYETACAEKSKPYFVVGSGNGFRRNSVLRRELSARFGSDILLPPNEEEAAVGAALAAGVGAGVFSDWEDAGRKIYATLYSEGK